MKTVYHCHFRLEGETYVASSDKGLDAFVSGFWINDSSEVTTGSDATTWIPPHAIRYIEKVQHDG